MADELPDFDDGTDVMLEGGSSTGVPRWVKVLVVITFVLVLLFVSMLLIGDGSHGPGMHAPA